MDVFRYVYYQIVKCSNGGVYHKIGDWGLLFLGDSTAVIQFRKRCVPQFLEHRTMDKVQKPSDLEGRLSVLGSFI
jgi:hypothetical protein